MRGDVRIYAKNPGYQELLAWVRAHPGLRPHQVRPYMGADGLPTADAVERLRKVIAAEGPPGLSRRRRWCAAALWQRSQDPEPARPKSALDLAYELLGATPSMIDSAIRELYIGLMMSVHPDVGGDTAEAQRVSEAYQRIRASRGGR